MLTRGTFSIVAADLQAGEVGCAVQSKYFSVGSVVPWARAGVGAVATQAAGVAVYGERALAELAAGADARRRARTRARGRSRTGDAPARDRDRRRAGGGVHRRVVPRLGRAQDRRRLRGAGEHPRRRGRRRRDGARVRGDPRPARRPARRRTRSGAGGRWRQARTAVRCGRRRACRRARRVARGDRPHLRPAGRGSLRADRGAAAAGRHLDELGRDAPRATSTTRRRTTRPRPTRCSRRSAGGGDALLLYNLACYESLAGRTADAVEHLRQSIALDDAYRSLAAGDPDFDPIRAEIAVL